MSEQQKNPNLDAEHDLKSETQNETVEELLEPEVETLEEVTENDELAKALEEVAQYKEAALRAHADAQNVRRRAEQDVEKAHKFGLEKFAKSIVNVADNLERALASAPDTGESDPVREGVELTLKDLLETLARFEVKVVDPHGEPFNPELHQAITMVPNPELEANTVMDVVQKGYTINGRLLRPAMVVVSSAA
ncbi:MAG: nucleotide exchange factor GrpE [Gammaproteobacteria bacterium]|jgi:molecular chaperone GrpE|uniref:Protein GrpE n=1 Tax=Marinomonas polaris DSM 16579 TaxID=1122206 RepID=A0A1M5ELG1_9GAMM|nr:MULTISPECIES: nucleotide exchange factor GrpE [Marinomonas]MBU1294138.1 nucleotide exchange factor GrpE [Gammaproteobacteria bacterium]MBU1466466.1 nucleotide exchange factor GrpE [Gammaproteobacteria bacterium]MBU2023812.1 nucleotide exchange factor GrpE [Gammaproteobacteria bacterium]MBU2239444.1 nucleotide exchange factor GrpE [Gammaproteobacteria bacterium]MBU2320787.1 nucleotide exchange factor GrpE [Gammaproteobacteria bacterium]|tara:strand:+ start:35083 stop:35661 length:579 start_codon:yes stop_codon:yes gene_type:complete